MLSPDSVQPNAPGTQGFNLYAYVANNPTTWVDPTGHAAALPSYQEFLTATGSGGLVGVYGYVAYALNCVRTGACLEPGDATGVRATFGSVSVDGAWIGNPQETVDLVTDHPLSPQIDQPWPPEPTLELVSSTRHSPSPYVAEVRHSPSPYLEHEGKESGIGDCGWSLIGTGGAALNTAGWIVGLSSSPTVIGAVAGGAMATGGMSLVPLRWARDVIRTVEAGSAM